MLEIICNVQDPAAIKVLADKLSVAANISTIVACIVAVAALVAGAIQFRATQVASRETQAVDLFIKFNQLNIEQALSSNGASDHWYNNSKFALTESLYNVARCSDSWRETVAWMLDQQEEFIKGGDFSVNTYEKKFRDFCKKNGHELKL